jgi:hypothetical protein
MRNILAAGLLSLAASIGTAHATDWWILNTNMTECETAASVVKYMHDGVYTSPNALETGLRRSLTYKNTEVQRDRTGRIYEVWINDIHGNTMHFYATRLDCETTLREQLAKGTLTVPPDKLDATAAQWWLLNSATAKCDLAADFVKRTHMPAMISPHATEAQMQTNGTYKIPTFTATEMASITRCR